MRILALDAATEACSVALLLGEECISRTAQPGRPHAPQVLEMVAAVLAEAQLSLAGLDGIAASVGPGAFTGVRISVAVAQGLAFGAGLTVVGVSTLEALALQVIRHGAARALACLDARMGEVYWGCLSADAARGVALQGAMAVGAPASVTLPPGHIYHGVGRGFAAYPMLASLPGLQLDVPFSESLPNAAEFARLGSLRLRLGEGVAPAALTPLYVRDKVALTEAERAAP
jgi:tRNA threonylcarbamoyladenosine biosynthesis protein TsaB